jgi:hypothetical protein
MSSEAVLRQIAVDMNELVQLQELLNDPIDPDIPLHQRAALVQARLTGAKKTREVVQRLNDGVQQVGDVVQGRAAISVDDLIKADSGIDQATAQRVVQQIADAGGPAAVWTSATSDVLPAAIIQVDAYLSMPEPGVAELRISGRCVASLVVVAAGVGAVFVPVVNVVAPQVTGAGVTGVIVFCFAS